MSEGGALTDEWYSDKRVDFRMRFSQHLSMPCCAAAACLALHSIALAAGTIGWFWAWWIIALWIEGRAP
jgi:hypothetical protein